MTDELKSYEALKAELKKSLQDRREQEDTFDNIQQEIYDKDTE